MDFSNAQYPGVPNSWQPAYAFYTERLVIGYRFYEQENITFTTGFPFGHGLSYTSFQYSDLAISTSPSSKNAVRVSFRVKNVGTRAGAEVAQVYLRFPKVAAEPIQLKGFQKTRVLEAGSEEEILIHLRPRDLSIWQDARWMPVEGSFEVRLGSSSRDIRLKGSFIYSQKFMAII